MHTPQQLWVGTYHGAHSGDRVVVTTTRDDTQPNPYGLECTCGLPQRYTDPVALDRFAWRHTHPTHRDRWKQKIPGLRHASRPNPEQEPTR